MLERPVFTIEPTGTVISESYGDVYFSREGGVAETEHVFLTQNHLPERWSEAKRFTIAETGFGTGLNFLTAWRAWRSAHKPAGAILDYISFELAPFSREELAAVLSAAPLEEALKQGLLDAYPRVICPGHHAIRLEDGRVRLTLVFGDARVGLSQMEFRADAWFLDGFSPRKNASLWSQELFQQLARHTADQGTFATFTCASAVKKGLEQAGFITEKRAGFGRKREMLCGYLPQAVPLMRLKPWFAPPETGEKPKKVAVIGGGIAGCSVAYSLAKRGLRADLYEKNAALAMAGSGNKAGVLYPYFARQWSIPTRFYFQALAYINAEHAPWLQAHGARGLLRFKKPKEPEDYLEALYRQLAPHPTVLQYPSAEEAALHVPFSWCFDIPAFCRYLTERDNLTLRLGEHVAELTRDNNGWRVVTEKGEEARYDAVVLANAQQAIERVSDAVWPVQAQPGSITFIKATERSSRHTMTLAAKGHVTPAKGGLHAVGSTYGQQSADAENLGKLQQFAPLYEGAEVVGNWSGVRAATPDRLPVIGPVPDFRGYGAQYRGVRTGIKPQAMPQAPAYQEGLYVSIAHGSRGLLSGVMAGEYLASLLCGEVSGLPADVAHALHPGRFLIRALKRGVALSEKE